MDIKKVLNFFFELAQLKRIKHEGWRIAGITELDSVGEHSLRAAQIAYVIARMEKYPDPNEVCTMTVFHDIGECRIGDIHGVARRYIEADELGAVKDQMAPMHEVGEKILSLWEQVENRDTQAGIIAKDADYLEQALTAKEYIEKGYEFANDWINNIERAVKTESAKQIVSILRESNSNDWWQGLKKLPNIPPLTDSTNQLPPKE
jgi:putative hydrolases of HD superfamily